MQLVFGRDAIFNIKHTANWQELAVKKQAIINKNNQKENAKRVEHEYQVGDKVLIKNKLRKHKFDPEWLGPVEIIRLYTAENGTIRYRDGIKTDVINIRNIYPYEEP